MTELRPLEDDLDDLLVPLEEDQPPQPTQSVALAPLVEDISAPARNQALVPLEEDDPNQAFLGLQRGFFGLGTSLGGFLQILGIDELGESLTQLAKDKLNSLPLPTEDDVSVAFQKLTRGDLGAASDWFLGALGNAVPSMAAVVVGGAGATLAAGPVAGLAAIGSISYILNSGEVYTNLREQGYDRPGAAAAAGIPMAFLDVLTPRRVFGKLIWSPTDLFKGGVKEGVGRAARLGLQSAGQEGITEAAQEGISVLTESAVTGNDFLTPDTMSRILNSFAAGAVAGGVFGASAQALSDVHSKVRPIQTLPPPTEQETIEAAVEPTPPEVRAAEAPIEPRLEEQVTISEPTAQQEVLAQELTKKPVAKRTPQDIINNAVDTVQGTLTVNPEAPLSQKIALNKSAAKAIAPLISETTRRKIPTAQIEQLVDKRLKQQGVAGAEAITLERQRIMNVFNSAEKFRTRKEPTVFITSRAPDARAQVEVVKETVPPNKTVVITEPETGNVYTKEEGGYRLEAANLADAAEASGHLVAEGWLGLLDDRQRTNLEKAYVEETRNDLSRPTFGQWLVRNAGVRRELSKLGDALRFHHAVNGIKKPFNVYTEQLGLQTKMSFLEGQVASEVVEAQTSLFKLTNATKKLKGVEGLDPHEVDEFNTSLDTSGAFARTMLTLPQFTEQNQHNPRVVDYLNTVRQFWSDKTAFTSRASETRNMWTRLGKTQMDMAGRYLLDKTTQSFEQGRKFNATDKKALANTYNLTPESIELVNKVDEDMQVVLESFHQQSLLRAEKLRLNGNEQGAVELIAQAEIDRARMSQLEFFPLTRFGKWVTQVKAKEGLTLAGKKYKKTDTVFRQQYRRKKDRDKDLAIIEKRFPPDRFAVSRTVMEEKAYAFMGFQPSLVMGLKTELGLSEQQQRELEELLTKLSPGSGHMKHMLKRQGIAGFSEEAARAYGDYMDHASNHIARLKNHREMVEAINGVGKQLRTISERGGDATSRQLVHQYLNEHYKYLMNPGNEAAALRGFIFKWYFVGNARQLLVNLTQVPLFTWSYLGANFGQGKATGALGKAYTDVFKAIRRPEVFSDVESQLIEQGIKAGFLDESFATEMAALGHGEGLAARMPGRSRTGAMLTRLTDMGLWPFKWSEGINRRVSFLAAVRLSQGEGVTDLQQLFEVGRDSVEKTQFEYARWARAPFTRGGGRFGALPPVLFMFRSFMQGALYFYATQPGRGRALVALLAAAGIMGLPGAEDVADITDWIVQFMGEKLGWKDPRTDSRKWIRETMLGIGVNPDLAMHGASRFTMGLYGLNSLAGIPVPALDLSGSLSFGRVIPGIEPATRDTARPLSRVGGIVQEFAGVAGNIGVGFSRALFSNEAYDWYRATPPVMKSLFMAGNAASEGAYTDRQGNELVPLDVYDTEQAAEVLALAMFQTQPTRLQQAREGHWARLEARRYYMLRRELLLKDVAFAHIARDVEGKADAMRALRIYNRDAPPGLKISYKDMMRSLRSRVKNRRLRELGLPPARRYQQIYRQYDPSFPVIGEE